MIAIYFSSTGNTKYCINQFISYLHEDVLAVSIEDVACAKHLSKHQDVILAYPIYFSDLPRIVREFLYKNSANFNGKNVFIISTMEAFSGDGAGCAARILKKFGANITGGAHIKMPGFILDVGIFSYSHEKNERIISQASIKIKHLAELFMAGKYPRHGLSLFHQIAGFLGQRLWMKIYDKTLFSKSKPTLDEARCTGCGSCVKPCPMANISLVATKAKFDDNCTLCYRCVNICNQKAITILGKAKNLEKSIPARF
ncbi:EFR1 family ferrodoxin [Campylobacter sp. CCUG 57310]|uniref:EFR1 family ferrodoxin n=1 Tax=Campylobacter sp. CCUG 57310 TaxID=2517362 RepID=UPI001566F097|nr:EFR1 family ferrodoxin [Campylobacter sp. CCUG 57310]QKF92009.1 flavodoxin (Flavodoxin_5 domain) [Campylobacter sp. CCUG 57310]